MKQLTYFIIGLMLGGLAITAAADVTVNTIQFDRASGDVISHDREKIKDTTCGQVIKEMEDLGKAFNQQITVDDLWGWDFIHINKYTTSKTYTTITCRD